MMHWWKIMRCWGWLLCFAANAWAQGTPQLPVDTRLNETITVVKNDRLLPVSLEVTVFKPDGNGPFPVVMINHGKEATNNRLQARSRYPNVAREFLRMGYAVIVPMRQGFSNSGGAAVGEGCNIAGNGEAQADDLVAVTRWIKAQAWADSARMIMMGQSHGGLTTLAYAQNPDPGYKLFVNFAGGLMWTSGNCQWQENLRRAFASYGAKTKVPTLWFYGENDSLFPPSVITPAHQAYVDAGGKAEMVAYGPFGTDAHGMFGTVDGMAIWKDKVLEKIKAVGLPVEITHPQFASAAKLSKPPATGFAQTDDVKAVPCVSESCRNGYNVFLSKNKPRAFATNGKGPWAWAERGDDPLQRALDNCNRIAKSETCKLYAVDDDVVWSQP
jgi:dienelactone hydrolase